MNETALSIPVLALLGFACWTVLLLLFTVGIYRWTRILTGRVPIREFRADHIEGDDFYKRAMRAHANCIENLPVFGAIVFAIYLSGLSSEVVDALCITVLVARITQSLVHISVIQNNPVVAVRFVFFFAQLVCFLWLALLVLRHAF